MHFHFGIYRTCDDISKCNFNESFVHVDTNRKIYNLIDVHCTALHCQNEWNILFGCISMRVCVFLCFKCNCLLSWNDLNGFEMWMTHSWWDFYRFPIHFINIDSNHFSIINLMHFLIMSVVSLSGWGNWIILQFSILASFTRNRIDLRQTKQLNDGMLAQSQENEQLSEQTYRD